MAPHPREQRYQPLALIGVTMIALLGFAVFFLSFLVAPLAILLIFYVGFAASDRSRRRRNGNGNGNANGNGQPAPGADAASGPTDGNGTPGDDRRRGSAALLAREAQRRRETIERSAAEAPPAA